MYIISAACVITTIISGMSDFIGDACATIRSRSTEVAREPSTWHHCSNGLDACMRILCLDDITRKFPTHRLGLPCISADPFIAISLSPSSHWLHAARGGCRVMLSSRASGPLLFISRCMKLCASPTAASSSHPPPRNVNARRMAKSEACHRRRRLRERYRP